MPNASINVKDSEQLLFGNRDSVCELCDNESVALIIFPLTDLPE